MYSLYNTIIHQPLRKILLLQNNMSPIMYIDFSFNADRFQLIFFLRSKHLIQPKITRIVNQTTQNYYYRQKMQRQLIQSKKLQTYNKNFCNVLHKNCSQFLILTQRQYFVYVIYKCTQNIYTIYKQKQNIQVINITQDLLFFSPLIYLLRYAQQQYRYGLHLVYIINQKYEKIFEVFCVGFVLLYVIQQYSIYQYIYVHFESYIKVNNTQNLSNQNIHTKNMQYIKVRTIL
eukprot:TRINITY_DN8524_c0_g1_i2.p2 TRINITY_DN8524_c0_g1~~TRINITY_DN8524_c0_g1_i2.p2  ORF type:complete len:231 (+),score=-27.93 TRINITY_DN8524_c0_g1_i2:142-834(+)